MMNAAAYCQADRAPRQMPLMPLASCHIRRYYAFTLDALSDASRRDMPMPLMPSAAIIDDDG